MNYQPSGFAEEIFRLRYAAHEKETFGEACERVAGHVAMAESGEARAAFAEQARSVLVRNLFMPGGRIWYGAGRAKGQLLNCFVVPTDDSREGWGKTLHDTVVISGTGGGIGTNYSPCRPRGTPISGTGGEATGAVSLMTMVNSVGDEMKAGGGRRTALMFGLNLNHGDLLEFLDKKLDRAELNNANVSVVFNDNPEVFFDLVRTGGKLELTYRGNVVGSAPARQVWDKILDNALDSGEPGLLNGYYANRMSNIWYWKPLICTNPCGEIWMPEYDCCCLGAVVLPRFVEGGKIRWAELEKTVAVAVRFLDNVLTVNKYPLPEIEETCSNIRRIGLGVLGLHDMLLMLGLKYNSPEGLEVVNRVMKNIKNYSYAASVDLATEKGPFPAFDADKFGKSNFVKTLRPTIRRRIAEYGIRNCALNTIAPTGTTSMVCGVTSGIEPMFSPAYTRRYRASGEGDYNTEVVVHPLLRAFVNEGRDVSHFQGAYDLSMRDHFEMQRTCQAHVDNAVSKTINVSPSTPREELSDLYMEFFPDLKGVTVYPEGSREDQPLTPMSLEEALTHLDTASTEATSADSCKGGLCDI